MNGSSGVQKLARNGWIYFEHVLPNDTYGISVAGSEIIDELRLHPEAAQMTTYTYEPLTGVTTKCDANNNIIYYEYDPLGRLVLIRDEERNIVKKVEYAYKKFMHSDAVWKSTGRERCKPCPQNNNYTTDML